MTRTVETYCGQMVFDDQGRLLTEVYAPGWKPLVGKRGRQCETCWHWAKRQKMPSWISNPRCPCPECVGMGYAYFRDLEFWRPAQMPKRGRIGPSLRGTRRTIPHYIVIRSRRVRMALALERYWLGGEAQS